MINTSSISNVFIMKVGTKLRDAIYIYIIIYYIIDIYLYNLFLIPCILFHIYIFIFNSWYEISLLHSHRKLYSCFSLIREL